MNLTARMTLGAALLAAATTPAAASEVTGNDGTTPLAGASICMFSGLNDDPFGEDPETNGPPGRTQSFGQDVAKWGADPRDPVFQPGNLCNPNVNPMKDIGRD